MYLPSAVVFVIFIATQALTDVQVQHVQQVQQDDNKAARVIENCALQTSANLTAIFHPDYAGDDPNFNCFFKCTFMTLGYVDQNGNTNISKYLENFVLKEDAEDNVKSCSNHTEENICDRVLASQVCVLNNINLEDSNIE